MDQQPRLDATMECPVCSHPEAPADGSSIVVAWYECAVCGHQWSARLRGGKPDTIERLDTRNTR
jgi:hypothetical protein